MQAQLPTPAPWADVRPWWAEQVVVVENSGGDDSINNPYSLGLALRKQGIRPRTAFLHSKLHPLCFLSLRPPLHHYSGGAPGLCDGAQGPSTDSSSTQEKSSSPPYSSARSTLPTSSPSIS